MTSTTVCRRNNNGRNASPCEVRIVRKCLGTQNVVCIEHKFSDTVVSVIGDLQVYILKRSFYSQTAVALREPLAMATNLSLSPLFLFLHWQLQDLSSQPISYIQFSCFHQRGTSVLASGVMSEPEQCIICLDALPRPSPLSPADDALHGPPTNSAVDPATTIAGSVDHDVNYLNIVAALDGCEHVIHDACIRSWAQKTNTCPICRNPFHSVRVYNGVDGEFSKS